MRATAAPLSPADRFLVTSLREQTGVAGNDLSSDTEEGEPMADLLPIEAPAAHEDEDTLPVQGVRRWLHLRLNGSEFSPRSSGRRSHVPQRA